MLVRSTDLPVVCNGLTIGVNATGFGRKLTLFQRHPAFPLFTQKVPLFLRISSLKKIDDITIYVA